MIAICRILACMDSIIRITRQFPRVYVDSTWTILKPGFCKWCQPKNWARTAQKNPFFPRRIQNKFPSSSFPHEFSTHRSSLTKKNPAAFHINFNVYLFFDKWNSANFRFFAATPRRKNNIPNRTRLQRIRRERFRFYFFGIPSPRILCKQYRGGERIRRILRRSINHPNVIRYGVHQSSCLIWKFTWNLHKPPLKCI